MNIATLRILLVIVLVLVAAPSLAEGRKTCAWPENCGDGGAGVPGLSGSRGSDETLGAVLAQRWPAAIDRSRYTTLYLDPTGSDSNSGLTAADPMRSLAVAGDLIASRGCLTEIVLASGSTWSATADFGACTAGAGDCGFGDLASTCTTVPDQPAIWIRSSDPDVLATIDCTTDPGIEGAAVISVNQATVAGDVLVTGVEVQCAGIDAFHAQGDGARLYVAHGGQQNDVSGADTSAFRAADAAKLWSLSTGGSCSLVGGRCDTARVSDDARLSLIDADLGVDGDNLDHIFSVFSFSGGGDVDILGTWLIGHGFASSSTGSTFGVALDSSGNVAGDYVARLARVSLDPGTNGGSNCIFFFTDIFGSTAFNHLRPPSASMAAITRPSLPSSRPAARTAPTRI